MARNIAQGGGGIYNTPNGTMVLEGVTINDNQALSVVYGGGGIRNVGNMELTNVTVSNNTTDGGGGGISNGNASYVYFDCYTHQCDRKRQSSASGAGIHNPGTAAAIALSNTIVANSRIGTNCTGQLTSNGFNLDSQNSCGLVQVGDITNRNPHLHPLEDDGGRTQTQRLGAGFEIFFGPPGPFPPPIWRLGVFVSAAVDAGDSADCPPIDQRGVVRPIAGGCDIGAYEFP